MRTSFQLQVARELKDHGALAGLMRYQSELGFRA